MLKKMSVAAVASAAVLALAACGSDSGDDGGAAAGGGGDDTITMGFAQVGAESGWRTANTKSIQDSAAEAGIDLKFSDAQQKQENQIKAIRSYIQQKVDVIAFSPVVESGWDAVLNEAKRAKIPVILTDRAVDSKDTSLYKTFLGSDFVKEGQQGRRVGRREVQGRRPGPINIVELQGTTGSAPAIDRKQGFADVIKADPKFKIIDSQTGEFTRAKGKEVMEAFLKAHKNIDLLYAHNDDMGLGAIEAIEGAGLKPGKDIKIVTDRRRPRRHAGARRRQDQLHRRVQPAARPAADGPRRRRSSPARRSRRGSSTEETTFTQEQAKAALPDPQVLVTVDSLPGLPERSRAAFGSPMRRPMTGPPRPR